MIAQMFATIAARWQIAAAIAAMLVMTHTLAYCEGRSAKEREYAAERLKKADKARELDAEAADKREADTAELQEKDNARTDAIEDAPDDVTDAPGAALACQRLRDSGRPLPAACGR